MEQHNIKAEKRELTRKSIVIKCKEETKIENSIADGRENFKDSNIVLLRSEFEIKQET